MLKCQYCDYTSKRTYNLNRHIELTHQNINTINDNKIIDYKCVNCDKIFASDYSLKRHMNLCKNVHHCEKNVHHCEKNVHHCEIIFNCSKCNKEYKTKKCLLEHEEKCIGFNILSCPKCMKTFSSRSSKSNHIKKIIVNQKV